MVKRDSPRNGCPQKAEERYCVLTQVYPCIGKPRGTSSTSSPLTQVVTRWICATTHSIQSRSSYHMVEERGAGEAPVSTKVEEAEVAQSQ